MIIVHHPNNSGSQRVLSLLEELSLPYEIKKCQRDPDNVLAPASLLEPHPSGKSPLITDGNQTVAESGVITEYVLERHRHERLVPPSGTAEHLRYTCRLHFAEGRRCANRDGAPVALRRRRDAAMLIA